MPYIEKSEYTQSELALQCCDLAALLDTAPSQILRWVKDVLIEQIDGKWYEPMQAIVAIANLQGRGRIPKPVEAWRERLGEKGKHRRAYLEGMAAAFTLVSWIEERRASSHIRFVGFRATDPAYDTPEE